MISILTTLPFQGDNFGRLEKLQLAYEKAADLLELAMEIVAHRFGLPYSLIDARSSATNFRDRRRNTQRMVRALERVFGARLTTCRNETGEMCVFLDSERLPDLLDLRPDEMAALDRAVDALISANDPIDAENLQRLRTKIRLLSPLRQRTRLEVDYEALLASAHLAARPGPSPQLDPLVMRPLTEGLLMIKQVSFSYQRKGVTSYRTVHPYGVIFGHRTYLLARNDGAEGIHPAIWRVDRMSDVKVTESPANVPPAFDIKEHAKRSFGAFHSEEEYGEVEWRFSPKVADNVLSFRFHPDQTVTRNEDGSVTVRFSASGLLEMAWALYPWGHHVEVVKPECLRSMVEGYQRTDFPGVP